MGRSKLLRERRVEISCTSCGEPDTWRPGTKVSPCVGCGARSFRRPA